MTDQGDPNYGFPPSYDHNWTTDDPSRDIWRQEYPHDSSHGSHPDAPAFYYNHLSSPLPPGSAAYYYQHYSNHSYRHYHHPIVSNALPPFYNHEDAELVNPPSQNTEAEPQVLYEHDRYSHRTGYVHRKKTEDCASPWTKMEDVIPPPPSTPPSACPLPKKVTPSRPKKREREEPLETVSNDFIQELGDFDVVCGRGAPVSWNKGNQYFRDLVKGHQTEYLCAKRADKPMIASQIMQVIQAKGGRFVRRVKSSPRSGRFGWVEIPEKRAYEKVCQTLREGAPEMRRKILSSAFPSQPSRDDLESVEQDWYPTKDKDMFD